MKELEIIAYYEDKFKEIGIIKNGLRTKMVSAFMNDTEDYSQPNELLCLSLILCFYKTVKKILSNQKKQSLDVKVKILCNLLKDEKGYFFKINLFCGIQSLSIAEIQNIIYLTHKNCPVSRMLNDYSQFKLFPVFYEQI